MPVILTPVAVVDVPESIFVTWEEFRTKWGEKNIKTASNKDNNPVEVDYDAVQQAFDEATDDIHNYFRGGPYAIPFDWSINGDAVSGTVKRWFMLIAYYHLYESRGFEDKDKVGNKLTKQLQNTYVEMAGYKLGINQLPAQLAAGDAALIAPEPTVISVEDVWLAGGRLRYVDGRPVWS